MFTSPVKYYGTKFRYCTVLEKSFVAQIFYKSQKEGIAYDQRKSDLDTREELVEKRAKKAQPLVFTVERAEADKHGVTLNAAECLHIHNARGPRKNGLCVSSWWSLRIDSFTSVAGIRLLGKLNLQDNRVVRSVPGRAFSTTRCRQPGCNETETLGHVLGFCRKGELLRNNRHHRVRGAIACLLRNKSWGVHEEIHCISEDDSHRRADIIAINRQQQKAIIIDPTIRMERDLNQAHQVDQEKRAIYEPCIPYLSAKYNIPLFNWPINIISELRPNTSAAHSVSNFVNTTVQRSARAIRYLVKLTCASGERIWTEKLSSLTTLLLAASELTYPHHKVLTIGYCARISFKLISHYVPRRGVVV
ncbi:hypothetical protein ANN_10592 [Periplaneta americana]|uniref:Reverse transcriptase n=1 Tax=Periplaneta americana TaxID=6978 RepID=A0ABQ8TPS3_PERAM|nr:hypothetical protein ANN_10592 [Periplaneta americana]